MAFLAFRIVSICGATAFNAELVQSRTTSGDVSFERRVQVAVDPDPQLPIESDDLAKIAA